MINIYTAQGMEKNHILKNGIFNVNFKMFKKYMEIINKSTI